MKTFKTPKGTELPLMDIKGKDYLQVAYRAVWFREEHPDWEIHTEIIREGLNEKSGTWFVVFRAVIKDQGGRTIATGHKYEDTRGFPDYIEKSETGAIGRALAMVGYGTQFAPDLDEGDRLADAPVERDIQRNEKDGSKPSKAIGQGSNTTSKKEENLSPQDKEKHRLFRIRNLGPMEMDVGKKYKGQKFNEIYMNNTGDARDYAMWIGNQIQEKGLVNVHQTLQKFYEYVSCMEQS